MEFYKKEIELNDGTKCILRSPNENDAKDMIEYLKITSEETHFMTRYPEEVNITINEERDILIEILNSNKDIMIAAFVNNKLAGNICVRCVNNYLKFKHRAVMGISIKQQYWNKGIGNILIKEAIEETKKMGYEQIELGVFADNKKAMSLYKKYGFEIWGKNYNAYKLKEGVYGDEVIMGKILQ